jgi:prepilin-type N-terminal cleavage/methylation domain-containing protein
MYNRLKKMRQEEGFTLIELLIVIVILGVLAAIVVVSVQGITDKGTKTACQSNTAEIQTAIQAYYAQTGVYPTNIDPELDTQSAGNAGPNYKFLETTPAGFTITGLGDQSEPTISPAC